MKSVVRTSLLSALVTALAVTSAFSAPETLKIDPSHSLVSFQVRHLFAKTQGRFAQFDGTVAFDAKNIAASSADVTIQAASINTENDRRDSDLRSSNFFEVEKYPTLTFKSTKLVVPDGTKELKAGDKFQILGNLTIRGVTRPVTLDATFIGGGPVGIGGNSMGTVAGFEASTTIDRKEFGIVWNRALDQGGTLLGDEVTINLQVEAKTAPQPKLGAMVDGKK